MKDYKLGDIVLITIINRTDYSFTINKIICIFYKTTKIPLFAGHIYVEWYQSITNPFKEFSSLDSIQNLEYLA